jgi:hypothetical protein
VYQECTPAAICIIYWYSAPLDRLRLTEEICRRLSYSTLGLLVWRTPTIQQAWTPPVFQHLVTRNFPVQIQPRSWRRPPRLPLHHATALQPWRQEAGEDSAVRLRGDTWPGRSARPMISLLGFRLGEVMEGYTLWAVATSAEAPILYGRFRPWSGEQPTGTYRFIATRLLRSQRHSNFCCGDMGLGSWR